MAELTVTGYKFYGHRVGFIGINNTPVFKLSIYADDAVQHSRKQIHLALTIEQAGQPESQMPNLAAAFSALVHWVLLSGLRN
jgi:hypothetical protein